MEKGCEHLSPSYKSSVKSNVKKWQKKAAARKGETAVRRREGGQRKKKGYEKNRKENRKKRCREKGLCGSVSVEAALALSIFIFAIVCMMIPFQMMERQRQVQAALESVNEKLCQYAYLEYCLTRGEELPKEEGDWKEDLLLGLVNGAAGIGGQALAKRMFSQEGMEKMSFLSSSFLRDGETVDFHLDYQMRMPFSVLGLDSLAFSSGSVRRAWIGRDGQEREDDKTADTEDDEIVYIGKNSTRYHRSRDCHYLANRLQSVDFHAVSDARNQSGGKYYPCAVCGSKAKEGDLVYIMKSGSRYHSDASCSAISAYVQAVKLSEVEHLGGCSYCCGK